ncbi:MAG: glycosyltransferase [Elusimicrobiota bacterium]|nr:glycosyltransferase [Elusimicrobiota bacterium]
MTQTCELTVVVPTLNEEGSLRLVLPRLKAVFEKFGVRGEVLVVDGRSKDATVLVAEAGGARVLTQTGRGLGGALREGILAAGSPWIAVIDADGSHPPEILADMWRRRGEADLVIASRYVPGGSAVMGPVRQVLSRSLNLVSRIFLSLPVFDASGGFRLYRGELARAAAAEASANDFTIQQELLVGILSRGGRVLEIPFRYEPRLDGASKASALRLAPAYVRMLLKLRGRSRP